MNRYNNLLEESKARLANKDEELKKMKTRYMYMFMSQSKLIVFTIWKPELFYSYIIAFVCLLREKNERVRMGCMKERESRIISFHEIKYFENLSLQHFHSKITLTKQVKFQFKGLHLFDVASLAHHKCSTEVTKLTSKKKAISCL